MTKKTKRKTVIRTGLPQGTWRKFNEGGLYGRSPFLSLFDEVDVEPKKLADKVGYFKEKVKSSETKMHQALSQKQAAEEDARRTKAACDRLSDEVKWLKSHTTQMMQILHMRAKVI